MTLRPCSFANASRSGMRAMVPSAFMSSVITPAGYTPARIARSTAASVCPARVSTPPSAARRGKVCPGDEKSGALAATSRTLRMVAARSCAEAPVVVTSLASMLTLNAVPSRLVFLSTMGAIPSSSSRREMTGMQTRPEPWRVMKLMCSAVTSCAATTRSPSFSRSSSSTTMTNLPAWKAAIASGTVARPICLTNVTGQGFGLLAETLEASGDVTGDDVGLEVDDRAWPVVAGDGHLERVGDQRDSERAGWLVHGSHGQADTVHCDGYLCGDEFGQGGRELDGDLPARPGAVHAPDDGS